MRNLARALLAGGLGFAVSCLAACGGGAGLLSPDQANTLNAQLDQVSSAVNSGNCGAAASQSQTFNNSVAALPQTVNSTVRANLIQGASTVGELAVRNCHTTTTPTTPTATATTTTATTSPTTTQSTTATTTTSNPPPTTSTSSNTTATTSGGGGLSGGQGNGGQGGGGSSGGAGAGNGQ
jgi:uncharacterized membrane protein YgcG